MLPPPAAEDYLVGVRRREGEEERLRKGRPERKPNAVPRLLAAGAIPVGAKLRLRLESLTQKEQEFVGPLLGEDRSAGEAEWTGKSANAALAWAKDGNAYSASGAVVKVLQLSGARSESDGGSAHGPIHWELAEDGRTLWEIAESLPDAHAAAADLGATEGGDAGVSGGSVTPFGGG